MLPIDSSTKLFSISLVEMQQKYLEENRYDGSVWITFLLSQEEYDRIRNLALKCTVFILEQGPSTVRQK